MCSMTAAAGSLTTVSRTRDARKPNRMMKRETQTDGCDVRAYPSRER